MDMSNKYSLFSVVGIELEYMIVDKSHYDVLPIADVLLKTLEGAKDNNIVNEVELGEVAASNELALHVIELKTNGPKTDLTPFAAHFHHEIQQVNQILKTQSACLMPTGSHPWYDPHRLMKLWPHGDQTIYNTFHRIFNCVGHGWSNLQSMHINLPFANDEEFSKLHSAIRLLMPLIPALTASTPFIEGKKTGFKDTRLDFYGKNQQSIPIISGQVIPEFMTSCADYEEKILQPMYQAIAPHDPEGIMQYEWLNSRGAIARFDRSAIEIRIVDTQECASADIACASVIINALKMIINETEDYQTHPMDTERLRVLYNETIRDGMNTSLEEWSDYVNSFHLSEKTVHTARDFWKAIVKKNAYSSQEQKILDILVNHGNLAERILKASQKDSSMSGLKSIYSQLCDCLNDNKLFIPTDL